MPRSKNGNELGTFKEELMRGGLRRRLLRHLTVIKDAEEDGRRVNSSGRSSMAGPLWRKLARDRSEGKKSPPLR